MAFSCFLVGTGGLLIQCGEALLARGHRVLGVLSPDSHLEHWAARHGLPFRASAADCAPTLAAVEFDFLFSIRNPWILPGEVLRLPRRMAINYHDAPLPAHAGSNSATWALLAGEAEHGISWHVMAERVDGGDLLRCATVPILVDETAFSLNMKCFQAALAAWKDLLDDIEADRLAPRPQEAGRRSYHRLSEKPPAGGVVSWQRGAEELNRLVRALDFSGLPNLLLCPKLVSGERFFIIRSLEMLPARSSAPPGTVVGLSPGALTVATASRDVALRELATIDGKPLALSDVALQLGIRPGTRLPELTAETAERLTRLVRAYAPFEAHWMERLTALEPLEQPARSAGGAAAASASGEAMRPASLATAACPALPMELPAELAALLERPERHEEAVALLITAFALALAQTSGRARFDIGLRGMAAARQIAGLEGFFAAFVPLRCDFEGADTWATAAARVKRDLAWCSRHGTYPRDLAARSLLPWREGGDGSSRLEIAIDAGPPAAAAGGPAAAAGAAEPAPVLTLALAPGEQGAAPARLRFAAGTDTAWAREVKERCERLAPG
jgi:methionyl-tRNA formyltransferase